MNLQEMALAMNSLAKIQIQLDVNKNWYVSQRVEKKSGSMLIGVTGRGATPMEAIRNHWAELASVQQPDYLVIEPYGDKRRAVRWAGFMWSDIDE